MGATSVTDADTDTPASYTVAVRALCEFSAKVGDLDLRFTPSPTAQEGIAGHGIVTRRRGGNYQAELSLSGDFGPLHVRGRADGYDPDQNLIEEIKTHRGALARMPANHRQLHWAQLRVYGHLLCAARGLAQVNLALVYFDIGSQTETVLRETRAAADLADLFADQCTRFVAWAEQELAHRAARDAALTTLRFPHADFRPGQRQLAETIFKAQVAGRCLLAQAPTGIGKTVGSLFPALKAAPAHKLDKIFFLAAKTPGRQLALDAAATISASDGTLPLRVLELASRDKSCEHPDKACHGDACPLARGFYDRLPAARSAALGVSVLDRAALREVALQHTVCPYYLGSEMTRWSDVIVGDYNYYFDGGAMLYGLAQANGWRVSVLVDEAHNMIARARSMYSCVLDRVALKGAKTVAPPLLQKALDKLDRAWGALVKTHCTPYQVLAGLPDKLLAQLQNTVSITTELLVDATAPLPPALQRFYFDALHFTRLAESFGPHSLCDLQLADRTGSTLSIRNIVPAHYLAPRFAQTHSTTLFSATLSPWHYYSDALGMPASTGWIDVASPFHASQLTVHVIDRISTRYQHRAASLSPIVALIADQYASAPGNYLAFFSSFDYLEQVAALFTERHPDIPVWLQARRMNETERAAFLARFTEAGCGVGFAVLGGAFGEGIDLPGARLVGAFIATLGLPQINPVNEQMRLRMHATFGAGYDYTYLYPGIQKVVQAAGRVIRTELDRGVVYLIDDRFAQPTVRALLPGWWGLEHGTPGALPDRSDIAPASLA